VHVRALYLYRSFPWPFGRATVNARDIIERERSIARSMHFPGLSRARARARARLRAAIGEGARFDNRDPRGGADERSLAG